MDRMHVILLLLAGLGLLVFAVFLRTRYGEKYELKVIDLVLIVLPLLLVLLVSGKLTVFDAFGIRADLSELFADAAEKTIESQIASKSSPGVEDVVNMLEVASKRGVGDIPRLIENKTEALAFRLGHGGYYGPAIEQYFDALYASSYLQYLIIKNSDSTLFGIYNVLDLNVYFRSQGSRAYEQFASWLNEADTQAQQSLVNLPGFVGADQAVAWSRSKWEVLEQMDKLKVDSLPCINSEGVFIGTIERSQLTASMILEVVRRLEGTDASPAGP
ncbi:hypothetical protein [Marinobacter sp. X15-166B]|uniref:hypothetical protein n=1 Tax=Marinobacter sp. X15-166B TaxID=1897620 RepID=UPI00085C267D|nr:hypothetical protein [Marinobacter sp. X15-166B]OEY66766.1 hypothetical protein BG841_10075 [Marinobacter sp. X15-166B]